jgi:hypothetical protein
MHHVYINHHVVYRSSSSGSEQQASGGIGSYQAVRELAKEVAF